MRTDSFVLRHIGPDDHQVKAMLNVIGIDSLEELIDKTVPDNIRLNKELNLDYPLSEDNYLTHIQNLASLNKIYKSFIGLGYHDTITPSVIQRNILENPGWYTAYTPYQAEISQGRLEALLNYQTMIKDLTAMDLANASLLDEGTAAAEAMIMLYNTRSRLQKKAKVLKFFVSNEVFPQTLSVLYTRANALCIEIVVGDSSDFKLTEEFFGAIVQYPGKTGVVENYTSFVEKANDKSIRVAVAADLLSLSILTPPGEWGAHVVVGTTQRFGIPLGYGGPHAAYFATKEHYKRYIPGRIIGITQDKNGYRALRMALQTREQHIKREKATSNICTSQVLLAAMAGMYAVYHGPIGIKYIATKIIDATATLKEGITKLGLTIYNTSYFDTLTFEVEDSNKVKEIAEKNEINFYYQSQTIISISLNETVEIDDVNQILAILAEAQGKQAPSFVTLTKGYIAESNKRTSKYMAHKIFNSYHSETQMMRYIKSLERKDLSLNHSMISLGSCTMKLNAASEMFALSMRSWNKIHPFVPLNQAKGYQLVINELENYLSEITGFYACSLQPNSGAQGEYAGLLVIKSYHNSKGDIHRNIVLIPASAHGTNPASAVMAGMKVVIIGSTEDGSIDLEDLRNKAKKHKDNLSALMITYPSTYGVFERKIKEITSIIHENGGKVYMDGANMNAQVGLTNPAIIGADVCHLNLHKTFAIPHGGGGPGVGPICVVEELAPFLPGNPVIKTGGLSAISAISSAPWGSSLVLLISYGYIKMLGFSGLKKSTEIAILNANYMKAILEKHYTILYRGEKGFCAHEMIVDLRPYKEKGIEVTDIAKRLIDYGYHAPTISFPVIGTMMIEPTESECKAEIDRFTSAMIEIRNEIDTISSYQKNNVLKNAPHTLDMVVSDKWDFPYSRQKAVFPLPYVENNKFWPSIGRVDDAYGDRNLVCVCEPTESYLEE